MPTPSEVRAFTETGTWAEITRRLEAALTATETGIENPEPYRHGRAVGERATLKMVLSLPDKLIEEEERNEHDGSRPVSRFHR